MITDPEQVREQIAALLAEPREAAAGTAEPDIDTLAARLEEAHEVLVRALESVDNTPGKDS